MRIGDLAEDIVEKVIAVAPHETFFRDEDGELAVVDHTLVRQQAMVANDDLSETLDRSVYGWTPSEPLPTGIVPAKIRENSRLDEYESPGMTGLSIKLSQRSDAMPDLTNPKVPRASKFFTDRMSSRTFRFDQTANSFPLRVLYSLNCR